VHRTHFSSVGAALLASAALAVPAVAAPTFKATLKTPKTQPKVGKLWDITVTAKSNAGRPLRASAYYQFVFNGQVVSTQYPAPGTKGVGIRYSPLKFTGQFSDQLLFPARSAGIPLTLRVVVTSTGHGTVKLNHNIRVGK
jgi:hypothetical protein